MKAAELHSLADGRVRLTRLGVGGAPLAGLCAPVSDAGELWQALRGRSLLADDAPCPGDTPAEHPAPPRLSIAC